MVWTERIERNAVEEVDKTKCQKLCGKKSSILSRLQGLIGLPVMTSLMDNAIHHPLWRKCREGRGYEERVKVKKIESKDTDEERKEGEQEEAQWKHARALHHCL